MIIHFTKMHGCGNDYVYINGATDIIPQEQKPEAVRFLSDRHFGIGGDGVIFINPSDEADFEMEMYNADGSRGEMCGNGIRCVAKFVYDNGLTKALPDPKNISVISAGSVKYLQLTVDDDDKVSTVRVDMGEPILEPAKVPVAFPQNGAEADPIIARPLPVNGKEYSVTCVSMGNPHCVLYVDDTASLDLPKIGPDFEHHAYFPNRINTEFVQIIDREHIRMRVWERGSGETLACGTGCCACVVAGVLNGVNDRTTEVEVLGGRLLIEWNEQDNHVYMTGPATTVFTGEVEIAVR
ncbi:MAG: diaminopimelate epimerase [Lachnospiraceae bacterium]|nr:diaminopimelate epimerase [Lachnospiraceae bacterium]